jgi:hypothetical protein
MKEKNRLKYPFGWVNRAWWKNLIAIYKKDVDDNVDPEKEIQVIYQHWIKSYLTK